MSFYIICPSNSISEAQKAELTMLDEKISGSKNNIINLNAEQRITQLDLDIGLKELEELNAEIGQQMLNKQTLKQRKEIRALQKLVYELEEKILDFERNIVLLKNDRQLKRLTLQNLQDQKASAAETFNAFKTSEYSIRLPERISLTGEWTVALVQFSYPVSWENLEATSEGPDGNTPDNIFELWLVSGDLLYFYVPTGHYDDPKELAYSIDRLSWRVKFENDSWVKDDTPIIKNDYFWLDYNKINRRVTVHITDLVQSMKMSSKLMFMCGFDTDGILGEGHHTARLPPDTRGNIDNLYVHTSVAQPVIVGSTKTPLLRVVGVTGRSGDVVDLSFANPHYVPLAQNHFQEIKISINTDSGELIHFQYGKVVAALHFKKK